MEESLGGGTPLPPTYSGSPCAWHPQGPHTTPHRPVPLHFGDRPTTRGRCGGHTSGVLGQSRCSGTGLGWGWMGPCGCQVRGGC